MNEDYWVGTLPELGEIVYDPSLQDDESEDVILFEINQLQLNNFNRKSTRGRIDKIKDVVRSEECMRIYREWKEQSHKSDQNEKPPEAMGISSAAIGGKEVESVDRIGQVVDYMQSILDSREIEIDRLRSELGELKQDLREREKALTASRSEVSRLQEESDKINSIDALEELARQAAYYASGGNETFKGLIIPLKLDVNMPIQCAAKLETSLRYLMKELDPSVFSSY